MKIDVRTKSGVDVLELSGKMSTGDADVQLRQTVLDLLEGGHRKFVIDMTKVPWMDSGSIGELVACKKRVYERQGAIRLVLSRKIHDIFTYTQLTSAFEIADDVDTALAGLAK